MGIKHPLTKSFYYAFEGVKTAFRHEPNLRIHASIAIVTLVAAALLKFKLTEWILLAFTIYFVIVLELINTVLESVVNLVSPEVKPQAKIAKDVSAAVVLFSSFIAVIVGILLFGPKILALL